MKSPPGMGSMFIYVLAYPYPYYALPMKKINPKPAV